MKLRPLITTLLCLVSVWAVLLPLWFMVQEFPPARILPHFQRFRAQLPAGSTFLFSHLTMIKLYGLALPLSVALIGLGVRAHRANVSSAAQSILTAGWATFHRGRAVLVLPTTLQFG